MCTNDFIRVIFTVEYGNRGSDSHRLQNKLLGLSKIYKRTTVSDLIECANKFKNKTLKIKTNIHDIKMIGWSWTSNNLLQTSLVRGLSFFSRRGWVPNLQKVGINKIETPLSTYMYLATKILRTPHHWYTLPPKQVKIVLKSVVLNKINTLSVVILWLPTFWMVIKNFMTPPIFLSKNLRPPLVYLSKKMIAPNQTLPPEASKF